MPSTTPFTRLPVTDLPSAIAAINDIYDKLNAVAGKVNSPDAVPSSSIPVPSAVPPSPRAASRTDFLQTTDSTLTLTVAVLSSVVLLGAQVYDKRAYSIKNAQGSTANVNLQSPTGQKIDGAAASAIVLTPGDGVTIEPTGSGWIVLSRT